MLPLAEQRMHGSSTAPPSKQQHEHEQSEIAGGLDFDDHHVVSAAHSSGAGDGADVVSRNVASSCSIESAIDSVIWQARSNSGDSVPDLPDMLPPELVQSITAVKDAVRCHLGHEHKANIVEI